MTGIAPRFAPPAGTSSPSASALAARVLLLVEDSPGDAELTTAITGDTFAVVHVVRLDHALDRLQSTSVDVIVLDLQLPDCAGVPAVVRLRETAPTVPIIVLTGNRDPDLATAALHAGAQDYLTKDEVTGPNLRRAIGYAIARMRETQLAEMKLLLERYRSLSSATQRTTVTAAIAGSGAIGLRDPALFDRLVGAYVGLFDPYLRAADHRAPSPRGPMERFVTMLGDAAGGPRDLVDVHVAALDRVLADGSASPQARSLVVEGRLLALEMMGLLVDYYRVGLRRWAEQGATS